ncbi:hypothetical protein JZO82_12245 [Vagococcus fluvialis]|uniref:hypothetical protein n=1 Tax=Vagococcus fluvialis TaxID=2738 RepID=UPI001A8DEAB3|nr:hypothetical protein [Vagococcus fluvialis]MBO0429937.1 hypothetical protein [Vagococcus fluvialis]
MAKRKILTIININLNLGIAVFFVWIGLCFPYLSNKMIKEISNNLVCNLMIFWIIIIVFSFILYKLKKVELGRHLRNIFLIVISLSFSLFISAIVPFFFFLSFPPVP